MAVLIKWKEPRSVAEWELKHDDAPEFKNLFRVFWKWSLIIGLPVLVATWRWLPQAFLPILYRLLLCCTAVPALCIFQVWVNKKAGTLCSIDTKGLAKTSGDSGKRYGWKEIESYHFDDYAHAPNVRCLVLKVQRGRRQFEHTFRFSPTEINEAELQVLMHRHLTQNSRLDG